MEKQYTKQDLRDYLDALSFVDAFEVNGAIFDFFMEYMGVLSPSYGELIAYGELAKEYMKERKLNFAN